MDVGDLEGLLGRPEALPRVGADALSPLGPVDHGGGVAAHRAGDAGVRPEAHDLRHVLLTRGGRSWKLNKMLEMVDRCLFSNVRDSLLQVSLWLPGRVSRNLLGLNLHCVVQYYIDAVEKLASELK